MLVSIASSPRPWPLLLLSLVLGCTNDTSEVETDDTGIGTGDTASAVDTGSGTDTDTDTDTGPGPGHRAVDILFVIDNSGSMGEEQGLLSYGLELGLVQPLALIEPPIDYRVAVTTTDNGNPWCGSTTPEAGKFVATSCRTRPTDFIFEGAVTIDAYDEACSNICTIVDLGLTEPWIDVQQSTGTTNVPGDAVLEALECMLPQGINGCGFEQPLESMWKAIQRIETAADPEFGFHRPDAMLAVVLVTDEADCSYNPDHDTIFLAEGNRVFWVDPVAASPTSGVCWNAGVSCNGGSCTATDYDENGNEVADPSADTDAVLYPLHRYVDALEARGIFVMAIDGVGSDGSVTYQDSISDPQFQADYGIGPGCESASGRAVPPVRIHELVGTVSGPGQEYSVCDTDYSVALTRLVQVILDRLPPA